MTRKELKDMENIFKTFCINFKNRKNFNKALDMNHLADDIGYSDMILTYSNKFFRDRFVGFLSTQGIKSFLNTRIIGRWKVDKREEVERKQKISRVLHDAYYKHIDNKKINMDAVFKDMVEGIYDLSSITNRVKCPACNTGRKSHDT